MIERELSIGQEEFVSLARAIISQGMGFRFRATGNSMSPCICSGDTVIVMPVTKIHIGDIVLTEADGGRAILHRVVRKLPDGVVTRGDSSFCDDEMVSYDRVIGKITGVSGRGLNFHLRPVIRYMIAKRILYTPKLSQIPILSSILKSIARALG